MMQIELPDELAEHIANLCDVWGGDRRPGFVSEIENRIRESVANEKKVRVSVPADQETEAFQGRVRPWMLACFGERISNDPIERNHRFLEESLELVQSCGCTASEAHQLVDYVFDRPIGNPDQEVGGVMVTLAALCLANDLDMHKAGERELERVWGKTEEIRAKQAAKPDHSPLPAAPTDGSNQ